MAETPTRILSLFSGIGGLDLGVRGAFPDSRVVCYVEREAYCCAILGARISEGALDEAPIFVGDAREFPAHEWRGSVDTVAAGFPCTTVSTAGKRRGSDDKRWLWPEVARVLRETEAEWCLVENVPGLFTVHSGREFGTILADLAGMGYDVEWGRVSAADVGAPHLRERIFILARLADARCFGADRSQAIRQPRSLRASDSGEAGKKVADGDSNGCQGPRLGQAIMPGAPPGKRPVPNLSAVAQIERNWMTPTARDYKDGGMNPGSDLPTNSLRGRQVLRIGTDGERSSRIGPTSHRQRLNPRFVEWLMGLPPGWTAAQGLTGCAHLETPSSQIRPKWPSEFSGGGSQAATETVGSK